jgi:hypothetical protein
MLQTAFIPIEEGCKDFVKLFVQNMSTSVVTSVISSVKPWDRSKFVTHLCLSLGRYDSEFNLFRSGSIRETLFKASSLSNVDDVSRPDVLNILRDYVLTDLAYHPISARQFARNFKKCVRHA